MLYQKLRTALDTGDGETIFTTIEEILGSNECWMVEDGGAHVGYFRDPTAAIEAAVMLDKPSIRYLNPPDRIDCDDDPV